MVTTLIQGRGDLGVTSGAIEHPDSAFFNKVIIKQPRVKCKVSLENHCAYLNIRYIESLNLVSSL